MQSLESIGFYTLSDERAKRVAQTKNPHLTRCELIVTDRCNFRCPYCRGLRSELKGDITKAQGEDVLDAWGEGFLENIRFSGGEPTLHPLLPEFVRRAAWFCGCDRIAVSTNGSAPLQTYLDLAKAGVNDFSISLDACCSATGDCMAGVKDKWKRVCKNIRVLAEISYVTCGVVLTPTNLPEVERIVELALDLGAQDVRIIPAAQCGRTLGDITLLRGRKLSPILQYRIERMGDGLPLRGLSETDSPKCRLVLDDMAVAGGFHFPCIIYLREGGRPIGKVGSLAEMRRERRAWCEGHDSFNDPICRTNCLDVCAAHNNRIEEMMR